NVLLSVVLALISWFASQMWSAVRELKEDLANLKVEIPTKYAQKDDLEKSFNRINTMLDKIFDKLDGKADK
ncbi:hypothetical protein ABTM70_19310, partial [Acinetobacter baumannii]